MIVHVCECVSVRESVCEWVQERVWVGARESVSGCERECEWVRERV